MFNYKKLDKYKEFAEKEGVSLLFFDEANEYIKDIGFNMMSRVVEKEYFLSFWSDEESRTITLRNYDWKIFKKQIADYFSGDNKKEGAE